MESQEHQGVSACLYLQGQEGFLAEETLEQGSEGRESSPGSRESGMGASWWA